MKMPMLKRKCEARRRWREQAQKVFDADFESTSPRASGETSAVSETVALSAADGSMLSEEGLREEEGEIPL